MHGQGPSNGHSASLPETLRRSSARCARWQPAAQGGPARRLSGRLSPRFESRPISRFPGIEAVAHLETLLSVGRSVARKSRLLSQKAVTKPRWGSCPCPEHCAGGGCSYKAPLLCPLSAWHLHPKQLCMNRLQPRCLGRLRGSIMDIRTMEIVTVCFTRCATQFARCCPGSEPAESACDLATCQPGGRQRCFSPLHSAYCCPTECTLCKAHCSMQTSCGPVVLLLSMAAALMLPQANRRACKEL